MGKVVHVSVSGILKKNNHVFVVKRSYTQRYFPGYWCFPGGKVSKVDGDGETRYYDTLVRELKEELDIDISNLPCRKIDITTTPEFAPYRFENHFFVINLDVDLEIKLDPEHLDFKWLNLDSIDEFFQSSGVLTIPPIPFYLKALRNQESICYQSRYLDSHQDILVAEYLPKVVFYMVPSKALPPSKHTNVLLIGDDEKLLIDPSPKKQEHVDLLIKEFQHKNIKSILISHWHPDHHEYASEFSKKLNIPLLVSQQTLDLIYEYWGDEYFTGTSIEVIDAGSTIELSGEIYVVKSHPGHANGQLGLESACKSWVFVSDMFQGTGSVVVENMIDYIQCLEELITYPDGTVFIPSHGFPIGGNAQLQRLLRHRLEREKQINDFLEEGLNEDQILKKIYPDLSEFMKRYALKNIKGHIERLRNNLTSNN